MSDDDAPDECNKCLGECRCPPLRFVSNSKQPRCVHCGKRKKNGGGTIYHRRFCSKVCAAAYGVSIAQTKEWDHEKQEWSPAILDGRRPILSPADADRADAAAVERFGRMVEGEQ